MSSTFSAISPTELVSQLKQNADLSLIDVREQAEWEIARIPEATLLPLSWFNEWIASLDRTKDLVVMCHHGIRSAQVCSYLIREGYPKVRNLSGGIDRWSVEVDPATPRY